MNDLVQTPYSIPRRLLLKAMLIAALISGSLSALGVFYPLDALLYAMRSQVAQKPMTDEVVLIGIDDRSLAKNGGWPWDRQILANEIAEMDKAGARRIVFDSRFIDNGLGRDDPLLKAANNASAEVYFGVLPENHGFGSPNEVNDLKNNPILIPDGNRLVFLRMNYDFMGNPISVPKSATVKLENETIKIPGVAALLSNREISDSDIYIDHSISHDVDVYSILDWEDKANVDGKDVFIIPEAEAFNDYYRVPFSGYINGGVLHWMAANSHRADVPQLHIAISVALAIACAVFLLISKNANLRLMLRVYAAALVLIFVSGWLMERHGYQFVFFPFVIGAALTFGLSKYRFEKYLATMESATDSLTGLPNGTAHVRAIEEAGSGSRVIVAATIGNSSDIGCVLDEEKILDFYREVERRILSSNGAEVIYHAGYDSVTWDVPRAIFPDPEDYAKALRALMLQPFVIDGHTIRADLSYGFDLDTKLTAYRRIANALNASQRAASAHKLYSDNPSATDNSASWRIALSSSIDRLLSEKQFSLAFQPKLNLSTGQVESAECLMRWTHPDFGAIPPSEFIEAAEQGSAIADLTDFALDSAMQALTVIRRAKPNFTLAVNLSPSLLDEPDLASQILEGLDSYGLDRSALILEITEAAQLADRSVAMDMLDRLAKAGVPLSIDDYGTGRSTLDYLRVIPAKEVKLDRSFVGDMIDNEQNRNLVESTINLAKTLGLATVAEGVENRATLSMLKVMGCTYVQGYHIGWPLELQEFTKKFIDESNAYAA